LASALLACASSEHGYIPPAKSKVTSLPGFSGSLPNDMYTGFIDAGTPPSGVGKMYFFYWCTMSARNPDVDPVLFWYNGGPGASSLFGLLQEWGPVLLDANSYDEAFAKTQIPTPRPNQLAWTQTQTVCTIDSPPPMGLSFCSEEGPGGSATSCGPWSDTAVFAANHQAHRTFFTSIFPNLKSNPFYFVGESYAGMYVPGFAEAMMEDPVPGLNFKGWAVGDGWPGCKVMPGKPVDWCIKLDNVEYFKYPNAMPGPYWDVEFFHGHSQMSTELYNNIKAECSLSELKGLQAPMPMSETCANLIKAMSQEVGMFFAYNLFDACPASPSSAQGNRSNAHMKYGINRAMHRRATNYPNSAGDGDTGLGNPCSGTAMSDWMALNETLLAINASTDSIFWNLDNGHGFNYTTNRAFVGDIYTKAIRKGLRVMVYEGDMDACGLGTLPIEEIFVPLFNTVAERSRRWHPWAATPGRKVLGGYAVEWEGGRIVFAGLRGAGHLLPANRPRAALTLMTSFTYGESLPIFPPNSMCPPDCDVEPLSRVAHALEYV